MIQATQETNKDEIEQAYVLLLAAKKQIEADGQEIDQLKANHLVSVGAWKAEIEKLRGDEAQQRFRADRAQVEIDGGQMKSIFQTLREKRIMQSILYRFELDAIEWHKIHSSHCYHARRNAYHSVLDLLGADWLETNQPTFKKWLDEIEARVVQNESEISPNGILIQHLPKGTSNE